MGVPPNQHLALIPGTQAIQYLLSEVVLRHPHPDKGKEKGMTNAAAIPIYPLLLFHCPEKDQWLNKRIFA